MADFPQGEYLSHIRENPTNTSRVQQLLEEAGEQAAQRAREELWSFEDRLGDCCDSPIEALFALAMVMQEEAGIFEVSHIFHPAREAEFSECVRLAEKECDDFCFFSHGPIDRVFIFPQAIIDKYRVDFVIIGLRDDLILNKGGHKSYGERDGSRTVPLVVECDGHDYHERTKKQAARDKARDRALQAFGLPVFRFTGSELHKNPVKCAAEVHQYIRLQWRPRLAKRHG